MREPSGDRPSPSYTEPCGTERRMGLAMVVEEIEGREDLSGRACVVPSPAPID
jgi:hypothetical protein